LSQQDLLLTTAEVAVAIAGFATLLTILGRRRGETESAINSIRLRAMLETSFLVIAFCFFPLLLNEFGIPIEWVWRGSSLGLALAGGSYTLYRVGVARSIFGTYFGPNRVFQSFTYGVIAAWEVVLLLNAGGTFPSLAAAVYVTILYVQLLMAGLFFLRLVASILQSR
jgi:hypothetical protein